MHHHPQGYTTAQGKRDKRMRGKYNESRKLSKSGPELLRNFKKKKKHWNCSLMCVYVRSRTQAP